MSVKESVEFDVVNHLSLFSGYEGFGLGLRLAGLQIRTVGYVEIDDYCQRVLQARMADGVLDNAPIIRDITACDFRPMAGLVDIVTAGFPCQPHSVAGARVGAADPRNLWPDTLRTIGEIRPAFIALENVPGLLAGTGGYGYLPGWPYRWRRHNQYLGEQSESLLSDCSNWNERKGIAFTARDARTLWRNAGEIPRGDLCLECWVDVVYLWGRSQGIDRQSLLEFAPETFSSDIGDASISAYGFTGAPDWEEPEVDTQSSSGCGCLCHVDERIEYEGTEGTVGICTEPPVVEPAYYLGGAATRVPPFIETITGQLSEMGYRVRWGVVSAADTGAPHLRKRWWCLAHSFSPRYKGQWERAESVEPQYAGVVGSGAAELSDAAIEGLPHGGTGTGGTPTKKSERCCGDVADASGIPDGGCGQSWGTAAGVPWWQVEPALGRVVDGCPDRVASIRALGNGIVPAVAAEFLRLIAAQKGSNSATQQEG